MGLYWRAAAPDVQHLVFGFVERSSAQVDAGIVHFPVAYPILRFVFGPGKASGSLWGSVFEARRIRAEVNASTFTVALTYQGAALMLGGPPSLAAEKVIDFDTLPNTRNLRLVERLMETSSFERRTTIVERELRQLDACRTARSADSILLKLGTAIARDSIVGSVKTTGEIAGLSERTLYNRMQTQIGCGTKRLLRIARLQRLLRSFHPAPFGGRPSFDPVLEFADEAHVYREFVGLTGLSPRDFALAKARSGDQNFHTLVID